MKGYSVLNVACPHCKAEADNGCRRTTTGEPCDPHRKRWDLLRARSRAETFVVRLRETDERLGVAEGEEYVAAWYGLDPGKVMLLRRLPDGFDPGCNQYHCDVDWVRWTGEAA